VALPAAPASLHDQLHPLGVDTYQNHTPDYFVPGTHRQRQQADVLLQLARHRRRGWVCLQLSDFALLIGEDDGGGTRVAQVLEPRVSFRQLLGNVRGK
jgi:hypothetical protein